ncbi:unnamed protein product, partial [marine sediment metagenome]
IPTMGAEGILAGVREYDREIRYMSAGELRSEFGFASSERVNIAKLIRNLIWQAYMRIRDGKREKIDSNIRGFWYTDVKPIHALEAPFRYLGCCGLRSARMDY